MKRGRSGWVWVWWAVACPVGAAVTGADIYKQHCAVCHGENGNGQSRVQGSLNPPPRDFTGAAAREELSRERMLASVAYGRPGTAMMSFSKRLDSAQIDTVIDYIRSEFMHLQAVSTRGQQLYKRHCSACHGENGNTAMWAQSGLNPPPRNFTDPARRDELTVERMTASVIYGRPGTAMMPFEKRLNTAEIREVVNYIRSTFVPQAEKTPASHPPTRFPQVNMAAPMPNGLRGNIQRGRDFFQGNCFNCHGREGRGDGPRARFNTPRPRDFTSVETRRLFNRPHLFESIRKGKPGTVMPAWGAVLEAQQIADVAEYVFQSFVQPHKKKAP
ncbi:MAG: c-type cytochrome [Pseudomonadota bacterium]